MSYASRIAMSWRLTGDGCAATWIAALAAAMIFTAAPARAQGQPPAENMKARLARWDKGPATIDVTNYPVALRESYKMAAVRCDRCHTFRRTVNSDYVLPDQLESLVTGMAGKWFSGINKAKSKLITDFLIYDASVRKKAQLESALAKLSASAKKAAEDKIAEVRQSYEKK